MKSILKNIVRIGHAIGYDGEPILLGQIYYSVGNSHFRFEIVNIVDKHNVEYIIDSSFTGGDWLPYNEEFKDIKQCRACYLISHNIYLDHYSLLN